jgi:hypothetical protein
MTTLRKRSTREGRLIPAEIPAELAAFGDAHAVTATLFSTPRALHAITEEIATPHAPTRGYLAEWAFWAGDAA